MRSVTGIHPQTKLVQLLRSSILLSSRRYFVSDNLRSPNRSGGVNGVFYRARQCLLQYNVMISKGIKPDVLTFTAMIKIMADSHLEWQAYRLFSSMLDMGIEPLPQTYVALKLATKPTRARLIAEIDQKLQDSAENMPNRLAEEIKLLIAEGDVDRADNFSRLLSEANEVPVLEKQTEGSVSSASESQPKNYATVKIDHPFEAWEVHKRQKGSVLAQGEERHTLEKQLMKMHMEELKVFLSVHRQLRNGEKVELVRRIVENIPLRDVESMLHRRNHYFRSVEKITKIMLDAMKSDNSGDTGKDRDELLSMSESSLDQNIAPEVVDSDTAPGSAALSDRIYTPWGVLRRPPRVAAPAQGAPAPPPMPPLEIIGTVASAVKSGRTDMLGTAVLRQYADGFALPWKRREPHSLRAAVITHVRDILPAILTHSVPLPTLSARIHALEEEGVNKTLEAYEALRVIALRTKNVTITDGSAENRFSGDIGERDRLKIERNLIERQRREGNVLEAELLKKKATEYCEPFSSTDESPKDLESRVLGLSQGNYAQIGAIPRLGNTDFVSGNRANVLSQRKPYLRPTETAFRALCDADNISVSSDKPISPHVNKSSVNEDFDHTFLSHSPLTAPTTELPPWELGQHPQPFNVDSGHFGDPRLGQYTELPDGKIRLVPQHDALASYTAATELLPSADQGPIASHRKNIEKEEIFESARLGERMRWPQYHKFVRMVEKNKRLKEENKQQKPLKKPVRIGKLLREGKQQRPISSEKIEAMTRPL